MNSQHAARQLSRYGRHGDNNLVHVSDRELQGIEQLTGRRFTRNPDTGLPEAFRFADLIPVAAGIGGTLVGGPLVGAAAAGATRTGVSAAQGKDFGGALMDGVIAGATGYATAGLMDGIAGVGAEATKQAAGTALADGGVKAALDPSIQAAQSATLAPPPPGVDKLAAGATRNAVSSGVAGVPGPGSFTPGALEGASNTMSNIQSAFANNPSGALGQFATGRGLIAAGGTAAQLSGMMSPTPMPGEPEYQGRPENFPAPRNLRMPGPGYRPGVDPEFRYFAAGGLASLPQANNPDSARNLVNEAAAALLGEHPQPQRAIDRFVQMFGEGALEALQDRIAGGRVRGAGGGLDDLVPGDIEGRQRVRLADGEFVVSSDVVSALGDGSTDQGARKLHEMMDRVRKAKTGSSRQPGPIDDDEVLPA